MNSCPTSFRLDAKGPVFWKVAVVIESGDLVRSDRQEALREIRVRLVVRLSRVQARQTSDLRRLDPRHGHHGCIDFAHAHALAEREIVGMKETLPAAGQDPITQCAEDRLQDNARLKPGAAEN